MMQRLEISRAKTILQQTCRAAFIACAFTVLSSAQSQTTAPAATASPVSGPKADAIYIHGNVYTGVPANAQFSSILREQAIAVRGDRILAVGKNADIEKLKGPQTQVIDLAGHFVMPGFNDAHLHLADAGLQKLNVDLTGVKSLDELREKVRARVEKAGPMEWIVGGGWDETLWPVKVSPNRWDLDEVSNGHPLFLVRIDEHSAVANTRALQLASITLASRDPEGGHIDRNENGEPTGILRETATTAVRHVIPKASPEKRRQAIELALADLAEHGVTSAQDCSSIAEACSTWDDFKIYEDLEKEGKLTTRIDEWLPLDAPPDELRKKRESHPQSDSMLHTGMLKGFLDGSIGSRTAALLDPYTDDANNAGLPRYEAAKLNDLAKGQVLAGFQIGFHAIGDKAIQMALDAFAEAETAASPQSRGDFRLRIEHVQVTTPAQIKRFKDLKVIASVQPSHLLTDMRWVQERIGPKRAATSYAWASLLNSGVTLAFGTDYPIEPVSPFRGLYAAVTRKSENGKQEFFPAQKLTMDQAIAAYTTGSAFAEFEEKEKGKLEAGMLADFVVLDGDVTAVSPERLLMTKVLRTVVGGKTVWEGK